MENIYFVESPLQLISAIDAMKNFPGDDYLFVKYATKESKRNNAQLDGLICDDDWRSVVRIPFFSNRVILHLSLFLFAIYLFYKFKRKKNRVFIGEFRSFYFNIFSRVISPAEQILLDDGSSVIALQKLVFKEGICFEEYLENGCGIFLKLYSFYKFIFRFKVTDFSPPNLYSIFNLDDFLHPSQLNYKESVNKINKNKNDEIYFFGAKYSESGILDFHCEITLLKKVFLNLKLKSKNVYYITHREDSNVKVNEILKIGYKILNLDVPSEVYFENEGEHPKLIAGFWTTVLYSASSRYIFDEVITFDISAYIKDEKLLRNVKSIYEEYVKLGMNLIEVK